jgi:hypothetical protein
MDGVLDWLKTNAVDLIGLVATLALLGVTAWYAKTTKEMATTAKEAAGESARATAAAVKAADAARDAATVAQSQIKPDFAGRLISVSGKAQSSTPCIQIKSYGDSVVIQRVTSRRSFRELDRDGALGPAELVGEDFLPLGEENSLPRRLHHGEKVSLTHPALNDGGASFGRFIVDIIYTFSDDGGAGGRRNWRSTPSMPSGD